MAKSLLVLLYAGMIFIIVSCSAPGIESGESEVPDSAAVASDVPGELPPEMIKIGGFDMERKVHINAEGSTPGYVMFAPMTSTDVFLVNKEGEVVHCWEGEFAAGAEYLMEDGRMIRGARDPEAPRFSAGGMMGRIQEYSWNGELLWEYKLANEDYLIHHDIQPMPNGNILAIVYEHKSPEESLAAGRSPHTIPKEGLWPDKIIEIKPIRPDGAEIVWEWRSWDHMIQDIDSSLPNYGIVSDHPELININAVDSLQRGDRTPEDYQSAIMQGMIAANASAENQGSDMFHLNAINYNAELDQIAVSTPHSDEIWIIDHGTTTEEASGRTGGKYGKGGDLLYRWGNPQAYDRGDEEDKILGGQHDVRWIPAGYPGEGHLTIFNNQSNSSDSIPFSEVIEVALPLNEDGSYSIPATGPLGPDEPYWSYQDKSKFFAPFISSAFRMKNGNTLVNAGPMGRLFEVTQEGEIVWDFYSPYVSDYKLPGGGPPQPAGPLKYAIFRATFIPADHPALAGKELKPLTPQPKTE